MLDIILLPFWAFVKIKPACRTFRLVVTRPGAGPFLLGEVVGTFARVRQWWETAVPYVIVAAYAVELALFLARDPGDVTVTTSIGNCG
ncbi:MAG: hypothetical protein ACPLRU_01765 [Desulfofundulus sp.]